MFRQLWEVIVSRDFLVGFVASLFVGILTWICRVMVDYMCCRSPFTGYWYSAIVEEGKIVKSDVYYLSHNIKTGEIKGKMKRIYPDEQVGRKWLVRGVFYKPNLIMYSLTKELNTSMASAVCQLTKDNCFDGYYLRCADAKAGIEQVEIHYHKMICQGRILNRKAYKKEIEAIKNMIRSTEK